MSSSSEDGEFSDIEDVSNGLILGNTFLPEEILVNILIFISWKDLKSCRLVCQSWNRIIDSLVCYEKLKLFSIKILKESISGSFPKLKSDSIPFYLYFAISNGALGKNLLKNAFGSGNVSHVCQRDPNAWMEFSFASGTRYINKNICSQRDCPRFKHWGVLESGGNGWAVESVPEGTEPLPPHLPERSCYVTSYGWCVKEQLITLAEHGLTSEIMDEFQPQFDISEWYARRWDCGIRYKLHVLLLDSSKECLQEFVVETGQSLQDNEWHEISHSFKDYGPGVRYVLFIHGGKDNQFWAGHYGSKIAGGSVIARIPSARFKRSGEIES